MTGEPKKSKQSPFLLGQTALLLNGFPSAASVLDRLSAFWQCRAPQRFPGHLAAIRSAGIHEGQEGFAIP